MPGQDVGWRTHNIGRQLICATNAFVAEKLRPLENSGFGPISQVHLALIQNIDLDGTRLTLAASRAQMTKQSMLELVDRAERLGLVLRRPDPEDGRAKAIAFTPKGLQMMERLKDGIAEAERNMAAITGAAFMARMRTQLAGYVTAMESANRALLVVDPQAAWRTRNVGRVLGIAFGVFTRDVQRTLHRAGFAGVSEGHMGLFRNLDIDGTRPSEIAARARMTKQAMTDLVRKTEALKLIKRVPDPSDGRAQMVMLTPKGLHLLEWTRTGVERAELRMAERVGKAFLADTKRILTTYVACVQSLDPLAVDIQGLARSNIARPLGWPSRSAEPVGLDRSPSPPSQSSRAVRVD